MPVTTIQSSYERGGGDGGAEKTRTKEPHPQPPSPVLWVSTWTRGIIGELRLTEKTGGRETTGRKGATETSDNGGSNGRDARKNTGANKKCRKK